MFLSAASYLLTQKDVFFDRSQFCQIVAAMLHGKDKAVRIDLPPPSIWKVASLLVPHQPIHITIHEISIQNA